MVEELEKVELKTFEEADGYAFPPSDIITFNELRSCADLYRMWQQEILILRPEYQREIVWKDDDQTRFIDSLIKQLPIPSLCFSLDSKTKRYQVIDGLQRMWSIIRFLEGKDWTLSKLEDIDPRISGQPVQAFLEAKSTLSAYRSQVQNFTLPVTIMRCDYSKKEHQEFIFMIFHRLNRLGSKLNNQEIRNCIFSGRFNDLLKELNKDPRWLGLNKMRKAEGHRFVTEEIILRFFAFHDRYLKYDGHLAGFLNTYMSDFRNVDDAFLLEKKSLFDTTVKVVFEQIFEKKMARKLSISVLEAVLVGVSLNHNHLAKLPTADIQKMYIQLLTKEEFSDDNLREGIAGKDKVIARLNIANKLFSGR